MQTPKAWNKCWEFMNKEAAIIWKLSELKTEQLPIGFEPDSSTKCWPPWEYVCRTPAYHVKNTKLI